MTEETQIKQQTRSIPIVSAIILTLGLLILLLLEYAIGAQNYILSAVLLLLLLVLSFLFARLYARIRRLERTSSLATPSDMSATTAALLLVTLTLLAAGMRLYDLGRESLWVDEVWTIQWAAQSWRDVIQTANPLAYVVAHFTLMVSRSEFALRFAPALAGTTLIPAVYLLGRTLCGRKTGLAAAALMAVSLYAIEHSQEVRFYSWQMLFSTLSLYFLLRGLKGGRWRDWAGFALTTALNLYNHPFAFFVLASEGLYTLWFLVAGTLGTGSEAGTRPVDKLRALLRRSLAPGVAALAALVAFLPVLSLLLDLNNSLWVVGAGRGQHLPLGMENVSWLSWPVAFGTYGMLAEYLSFRSVPFLVYPLLVVFFLGLLSSRRHAVIVLSWFLVPLPILFLMKYWLQPRYLSYFLPLFLIVTARGIAWLAAAIAPSRRNQAIALAALAGLVALPGLAQLPAYYAEPQEDQWREVTAFVESNYRDGDLVLVNSAYDPTPLPIEWYATVPADALPRRVFPQGPVKGVLTHLEQLDSLPAAAQGHPRVWFVFCHVSSENQALIAGAMPEGYQVVEERHFVGLDLALLASSGMQ